MIAIANVAPHFKCCWLKQWNSSSRSREAVHFSMKPINEERLGTWLTWVHTWLNILCHFLKRIRYVEFLISIF
jgi:hypothetical protein